MEAAVERMVALAFLLTGLSHIFAPAAWLKLFAKLRTMGASGGLLNALLHAPTGIAILAFHPVWSGPGLFVTLVGAALALKALLYAVRPELALRSMARAAKPWQARAAGLLCLVVGAAAAWISTTAA